MKYNNSCVPREDGRRSESHRHGEGHRDSRGGSKGGHGNIAALLDHKPNAMLLFVGAIGCTRHRGFQMGELMREGRMALLCPTATDFATGRYLRQVTDAMVELRQERNIKEFVVMYGCQWAVLSTDFDLLTQELREEHGISATLHEHCHLCRTEHDTDDDSSMNQEVRSI